MTTTIEQATFQSGEVICAACYHGPCVIGYYGMTTDLDNPGSIEFTAELGTQPVIPEECPLKNPKP